MTKGTTINNRIKSYNKRIENMYIAFGLVALFFFYLNTTALVLLLRLSFGCCSNVTA